MLISEIREINKSLTDQDLLEMQSGGKSFRVSFVKFYNWIKQKLNLADVAYTGNFQDLSNIPPLPTRGYIDSRDQETFNKAKGYTDSVASLKVDKESGKGLSSNDYSDSDKSKMDSIQHGATRLNPATSSVLGGIKVGQNLDILPDGTLSARMDSQVNSDWNATEGVAEILNKPDLSVLATSEYVDDQVEEAVGESKEYTDTVVGNIDYSEYATKEGVDEKLLLKVDKEEGKQLSDENYTLLEKDKLAGIEPEATKNATDAQLRDRATHTGVQPISTIANLQTSLDTLEEDKVDKEVGKQLSTEDYTTAEKAKLLGIEGGAQVNPTPVDNLLSDDVSYPLSARQGKVLKGFIDTINDILTSDDTNLDELQEIVDFIKLNREDLDSLTISSIAGLEDALSNKQPLSSILTDTSASFTTILLSKLNSIEANAQVNTVDSVAGKAGVVVLNKTDVGLSNVDNTSDVNKPISSATQAALSDKVDKEVGKQLSTEDFTTTEKSKLSGIAVGATQNAPNASLRDRATHTGVQPISSVEGLQTSLNTKASVQALQDLDVSLATVAKSGDYESLVNKPTIPEAQVNANWNSTSGVSQILNKPTLGTAASQNVGAFATASQGVLADTAVQPSDLTPYALTEDVPQNTDELPEGVINKFVTQAEKDKIAAIGPNHYKGIFATLADLIAGVPSPVAGDYAEVSGDENEPTQRYFWDSVLSEWVPQGGAVTPEEVKTLYESNPNTNAFTDSEKGKLSGIAIGATVNATNAQLRDRSTHTGTQAISTVEGLQMVLSDKANVDDIPTRVSELENDSDFISVETDPTVPAWAKQPTKPTYTKSEVGLDKVDNTSDADKPVSSATQSALDLKVDKQAGLGLSEESYTTQEKTKLVGIEEEATKNSSDNYLLSRANHTGTQSIGTIEGLEDALADAGQVKTVAGESPDSNGNVSLSKSSVGLDQVDNTPDIDKPISSAQLAALGTKVDKVGPHDYTASWSNNGLGVSVGGGEYPAAYVSPAAFVVATSQTEGVQLTASGLSAFGADPYAIYGSVLRYGGPYAVTHNQDLVHKAYVDTELNQKVDKETGYGLSQEDYTSAEKNKLSGIATEATKNATDAQLRNRSTHTGTQLSNTISDLEAATLATALNRLGGASSTTGVLDWNEHTEPGIGPVLLMGSAANGPGGGQYHFVWNLEYGTGRQGNGNITQIAIPYGNQGSVNGGVFWFRGRYSGDWTGWERTFTTVTPPTIAQIPQLQTTLNAKVSTQAGYSMPANTKQTQWDTAYGWGNHASAGYATTSALTSGLSGKVDSTDSRLSDSREWSAGTVTQSVAEAGTSTARFAWTAQRVRQAITAWWGTITQANIRTKAGIGTNAEGNRTVSTGDPSGGSNGDIWMKVDS